MLALAALRALGRVVGLLTQALFFLIALPIAFLVRQFIRPVLLLAYRWSLPLRLGLKKLVAPARQKFFYPLTTRPVVHILIGLITIVVSSNSLAAKELQTGSQAERTLLARILDVSSDPEVLATSEALPPTVSQTGALALTDANQDAVVDEEADIEALEKPLLTDTTAAGQPRQAITHYQVLGGDTLSTIAERFGVSTRTLLWANGLDESSFIKPGQDLTIPPVSGVLHRVKSGDTLQGIANKYKANLDTILEFNHLATAEAIQADQLLVVPGGEIEAPAPAYAPRRTYAGDVGPAVAPPSVSAPRGGNLLWPTPSRRINRGYLAFHRGLDIDGNVGSPVYAAEDGRVESVVQQRYGYGYYVVINHGGGKKTLYAHNGKMFVKPGQSVNKGQTIATVGMTGRTTGPHLHFEVFINGVKVNPWGYLR